MFEFCKLVWKHIALRDEVELVRSKLVAHLHEVHDQLVLPCQLCGVEEVIDLLVLTQAIIDLLLVIETAADPEQRPVEGILRSLLYMV